MAEIKTRPATPEYRKQWEKIFGKDKATRPDMGNGYDSGWSRGNPFMVDGEEFHAKTYESAHA